MPYINKDLRNLVNCHMEGLHAEDAGQLNYAITTLILGFIERHGETYSVYNDCVGALECAKLELYRREIVPYEDKKVEDNGDVY